MDDSKLTKFNHSCRSDCFECSIGSNGEKPGKMAFDFSLLQPISRRDKNRAQAIFNGHRFGNLGEFPRFR